MCPIEYDYYEWETLDKNPVQVRAEAEKEAFASNPKMTLLRPNLVFGNYTYFVRYLEQSLLSGKVPAGLVQKDDFTKYHPVFAGDLFKVIQETLNSNAHQGQAYHVNGSDNVTINQLLAFIQKSSPQTPKITNSIIHTILDKSFELINGKSHDANMKDLVYFYRNNFYEFHQNDFFRKHGWTHETNLDTFYTSRKELSDIKQMSSPEPFNYKR